MDKIKRDNLFLIIWISCILFLVGVCNIVFIRGTRGAFGNMTGQLTPSYVITFDYRYPEAFELPEYIEKVAFDKGFCNLSEYHVSFGQYSLYGWNTEPDGSGEEYLSWELIVLDSNMTLYAQWKWSTNSYAAYGDVNENNILDEEDYLLVEKYLVEHSGLTMYSLRNADVNNDGKVDLIDADIIKQAYLGTDGYVGYLPRKPILKYEIYVNETDDDIGSDDQDNTGGDNDENKPPESDEDKPSLDDEGSVGNDSDVDNPPKEDDETSDNDNNSSGDNSGDSTGTGSGNGTGASGSGNSSSGNGGANNKPSSGGNTSNNKTPNSGNGSSGGGNQDDSSSKEEEKENANDDNQGNNIQGDNEYLETEKDDYVPDAGKNNVKDNTNDKKKSYVWIIVFGMCLISFRLIVYVVNKFKEKEKSNKSE